MFSIIKNNFLFFFLLLFLLIGLSSPGFAQGTVTYGLKVNGKEIISFKYDYLRWLNDSLIMMSDNTINTLALFNTHTFTHSIERSRRSHFI